MKEKSTARSWTSSTFTPATLTPKGFIQKSANSGTRFFSATVYPETKGSHTCISMQHRRSYRYDDK